MLNEETLELCHRHNIHILRPEDAFYPARLKRYSEKPPVLFVRGRVEALIRPAFAIVGSRYPMSQTRQWMERHLPEVLSQWPLSVVSGGARGVDQVAHALALKNAAPTVCFSPSGLLALYPRDLEKWVLPIEAGGGCLVSPFAPREEMHKYHFVKRNRLIAAIAELTLIIQARRRSGTMLTARAAQEQGGDLAVVPYFPDSGASGSMDLLAEGSNMVRDGEDLNLLIKKSYHL